MHVRRAHVGTAVLYPRARSFVRKLLPRCHLESSVGWYVATTRSKTAESFAWSADRFDPIKVINKRCALRSRVLLPCLQPRRLFWWSVRRHTVWSTAAQ